LRFDGSRSRFTEAVADGQNLFDMNQMWGAILNARVVKAGDGAFAQE